MKLTELQNKKILIVGYGTEGKATEKFLKAKLPDVEYAIVDKSQGQSYLNKQKEYDLAVRSPGVHPSRISIPSTTATNIFFANVNREHTIGITGTKGKSTIASLIAHFLSKTGRTVRLAGNIGTPLLSALMDESLDNAIFVCELSSYQLMDIQYSPHIAVVNNLFQDHLNYHGSVEDYYEAKKQIIKFSSVDDYFIYNQSVQLLTDWAAETKAKSVPFETDFTPDNSRLVGEHNMENVRAAITVARLFDMTNEQIESSITSFKPLPHRLENVGTFRDITFYDDAISTTPESTIAALNAIKNVGTIFLGGLNRGYEFETLAAKLKEQAVENVVLFPDSGVQIKEAFENIGYTPQILETQDMEKAVQFAYAHTPQHGVCLLSTASPSYSIWKNFEEKGSLFQQLIRKHAYEKTDTQTEEVDS